MRRKLIQHGASSLTITLPQEWLQRFKLEKGDEVEVGEIDSRIIVSSPNQKEELVTLKLEFKKDSDFNKRSLEIPYIEGIDEIEIEYHEQPTFYSIQNETNRLLGYEIVNQTGNKMLIKNIAKGMEPELDALSRRILRMLIVSCKEVEEALRKGDYTRLDDLINIESVSAKLIYFFLRNINMSGYKNKKKTYAVYAIIWAIEQVFDNYRDIAKYIKNKKTKLTKEELSIFGDIVEYIELFYNLAYNFSMDNFHKFYKVKPTIEQRLAHIIEKGSENEAVLMYLFAILDKIYHIGIFFSPTSHDFL